MRCILHDAGPTLAVADMQAASRDAAKAIGIWLLSVLASSPSLLCIVPAFVCSASGDGGPASQVLPSYRARPLYSV